MFLCKKRAQPDEPRQEPPALATTGGTLEGNPTVFRDGHYVRLLERANRRLSIVAGVAIVFSIAVSGFALALFPLKTVETRFVRFDAAENQTVRLLPSKLDRTTEEQLIHSYLRQYVEKREAIDHTTEASRYRWVQIYTAPEWYAYFRTQMSPTNTESPLRKFADAGLTREIHVTAVMPIPGQPYGYQVEYLTIDRRAGAEVQRGEWIATLAAYRQAVEGSPDVAELNPLGLTVANYAVSARTLPPKPGSAKS